MTTDDNRDPAEFDDFARNYDEHLNRSIAISGEDKDFFAIGRVRWLAGRLQRWRFRPRSVLDFGCGTGTATPLLLSDLAAESVTGVDVSDASLAVARENNRSARVRFAQEHELGSSEQFDLAFCNGVFHHIPIDDRLPAARRVLSRLRPGGMFAFFENNAWHPGTRYCMRINPFDRDAKPIGPIAARRLLAAAGFVVSAPDFLFVYPRILRALRFTERLLCHAPLGAQYLVMGKKVANDQE